MHLRIQFHLGFFFLSILTLVSFVEGQEVSPNTKNVNIRTRISPGTDFAAGYQPSGSGTYDLGVAVPYLNHKESSNNLQLGSDFNQQFNGPGGYASSRKFSDENFSFMSHTGTNANRYGIERPADSSYIIHDRTAKFAARNNYNNGFNLQQYEGNTASYGLRNMPVYNQNSEFKNGNIDMTKFFGGTVPDNNHNIVISGSLNKGPMKTLAMLGMEQNAGFNNVPLSNTEVKTFSAGPIASLGSVESKQFESVINDGVFPRKGSNNGVFARGVPFNPTGITPESASSDKTATPDRPATLNTYYGELHKILLESGKLKEVKGRKKAAQKKTSGIRRRSRSTSHSKTKCLPTNISSDSGVRDVYNIIKGVDDVKHEVKDTMDSISTATPETSSVPVKKDLPSFLASALNQFDTPSTVHYISSAISLLVSDEEFDLASLPPAILALTMQIRSAFPGLSNCELLNQVFLELIIALGHTLKYSKVGDVNFDSIAETAELVMKAF